MPLSSPRFSGNVRLQQASRNSPAMHAGERDRTAVALVQHALVDLGFRMPRSTQPSGAMDGLYGQETESTVSTFQRRHGLKTDGVVGRNTLAKLDSLVPAAGLAAGPAGRVPYLVPGLKPAIAQPSNLVCWATVYTMMRSWKDRRTYDIGEAVAKVGPLYRNLFDANNPLPAAAFAQFLQDAGLSHKPMLSMSLSQWIATVRSRGLLWIGTLNALGPGAVLHSRIIEGVMGDGSPGGSFMRIIDPAGGRRYNETFATFQRKYEGARRNVPGQYLQVRHF